MQKRLRLGSHAITDEDVDLFASVFKDPQLTSAFVRFLADIQTECQRNQDKCAETFMVSDDTTVRALGLGWKGKVELLDDLIGILTIINK